MGRAATILALCFCVASPTAALAQGSLTRTSSFVYNTTSGLLTREVIEPNASALRLQTDYQHDAFGNKTTVTVSGGDIATRTSTTTYDARGQFVETNTNALQHSESWQFDKGFGTPKSQTGPNNLTTTWDYDEFGRKTVVVRADLNRTKFFYEFCNGISGGTAECIAGASYRIKSVPVAADDSTQNGPISIVYFDSLEREVGRDTQGFDGATVRALRQYDALGRVEKTSRPFFAAGSTPQWTIYEHDALGRVTRATGPDGAITRQEYHGLVTIQINAKNQKRTTTKNARGEVVQIKDALNKIMSHEYDPFGNLTKTTDHQGNVVTAVYDLRGRRTDSHDPDLGHWTYQHNVLGEVHTQIDAKLQTTTFNYDSLGRLVQRVEPDKTSAWVYGTAIPSVGKLISASITAGRGVGYRREVTYDSLSRPFQVATTIDGATYTMAAIYDSNGRLRRVAYPSGFIARYTYNALGYARQLKDHDTGQLHWTLNALDAEQHVTSQTSGNGVVTTRMFEAATGRLSSVTAGAGNLVQSMSYSYDLLGNPVTRGDDNTGLSEGFTYDALNRLTAATVSSGVAPVKNFTYDAIGNLKSKSDVGTYNYPSPGSPRPHAVTSISGGTISTTFTYDPNGNQTSGLGRSTTWTAANKPLSITQGATGISFEDDIDHQRFKQVTPGGTILYVAAFGVQAELLLGAGANRWTDYLSVGNQLVGMRVTDAAETVTTRYFHTDHLGSIAVITDETGLVVRRISNDAWGKRRFPNGADDPTGSLVGSSETTRGFTGAEHLSIGSLVHLNGRVYDALVGRMISADPVVPDALNPQAWNRYSYVGNSPLTFTDPSGHSWLSDFFRAIGNFFSNLFRNPIVRAIATIVIAAILWPLGPVAAAAISSAAVTGLAGGKLGDILKAGLIAGATALAFFGAGKAVAAVPVEAGPVAAGAVKVATHAGIGCISAIASGGKCGPGALSAGISAAATPFTPKDLAGGTAAHAVIGGLASVAGGGKFENGAVTAAFGYLYNHLGHMLVGTDAHYQLVAHLQLRDGFEVWEGNTTLDNLFGTSRPDLIYLPAMPREVYEIKPFGSEAEGAAQLRAYLNTAGAQAASGDFDRIFRAEQSLTLTGGWFGATRYTYRPSVHLGVVTYTVDQSNIFEQALRLFSNRPIGGPLPLGPRLPPVRIH